MKKWQGLLNLIKKRLIMLGSEMWRGRYAAILSLQPFASPVTRRPVTRAVCVMAKIEVKIFRDVAKNPNVVEITRRGRKIKATYDGDNLTLEGPQGELPSISECLRIAYPYEIEQVSRPAWYDRNPKNVGLDFSNTLGPHVEDTQITYTVPPDRKCIVEVVSIHAKRLTAGAGDNWVVARWLHNYESYYKIVQNKSMLSNTVGDVMDWSLGGALTMLPGENLNLTTEDQPNAGGTVLYECGFKGTEFDA